MSQYPSSPYGTPNPHPQYWGPQSDPSAAARRAGVMTWIVAAILGLSALCCGGIGAMWPSLVEMQPELMSGSELASVEPQHVQIGLLVFAGALLLVGILKCVLAIFVGRSHLWAIIVAMILSIIICVVMLLQIVGGVTQLGGADAGNAAVGLGILLVLALAPVLQLVFLIQAASKTKAVRQMREQQAWQWYQYQQNLQTYQQQQQQQQPPRPPGA